MTGDVKLSVRKHVLVKRHVRRMKRVVRMCVHRHLVRKDTPLKIVPVSVFVRPMKRYAEMIVARRV